MKCQRLVSKMSSEIVTCVPPAVCPSESESAAASLFAEPAAAAGRAALAKATGREPSVAVAVGAERRAARAGIGGGAAADVPVVPAAPDWRAAGFGPGTGTGTGTGRVAAGDSAVPGAVEGEGSRTMRIRGGPELIDSDSLSVVTVWTSSVGTLVFVRYELGNVPVIEGAGVLVMVGTRCIVEIPVVDSFGFAVVALD